MQREKNPTTLKKMLSHSLLQTGQWGEKKVTQKADTNILCILANVGCKIDFALSEFGMVNVEIKLLVCRGAETFGR